MSTTINNMLARQLRFRAWREANAGTEADQRLSQLLARLKHAGAPDEAQWEVIGHFMSAAVSLSAPPPPAESFLSAEELALGTPLPSDVLEQILADMDRVALMPPRTDPTPLPYPDPAAADAPFPLPPLPAPFPPLINRPVGSRA